ncbi:MAG: nicotinamide mononucleotide transporter [Flavobacteriales bacterium]|jgi:nicotinamide mononucleotide transporter|nr:nicotinamide mononucleotide transporter [Flavobacteriales bacterium]MBT6699627.1 nicotinamide mononucleotide transporter [Flavobacteriales bacterium]MBT7725819.1 nicotinamide mononucleotide transporter [Flavobacteriales bacterium]
MEEIIQIFSNANLNWITICAAISGILYIILAAKENVWCWLAASISVCLYMYINYDLGYYSQAVLQIFYLFMAIYGYVMWNKLDPERIKEWSAKKHLFIIFIGAIITFIIGFILTEYVEDSEQPILDSLTTVFSVFASYMVAKKVLGNWLYWIVIDSLIIYLYYIQGEFILALQFLVYIIIAVYGYFSWIQRMKTND